MGIFCWGHNTNAYECGVLIRWGDPREAFRRLTLGHVAFEMAAHGISVVARRRDALLGIQHPATDG